MEFEEIKEWLDWHVADIKERRAHAQLNSSICTCFTEGYIHMHRGIEIIADALGIKLEVKKLTDDVLQYSFMHDGIEVVQLDRREDAQPVCM